MLCMHNKLAKNMLKANKTTDLDVVLLFLLSK